MRAVSLSAPTFDLDGHVRLLPAPESDTATVTRRVNRTATLDGGAAINDFGSSDADRTLSLAWPPHAATDACVARMVRLYPRLVVSMADGVYSAAPESFRPGPRESRLVLLVIERLDADT